MLEKNKKGYIKHFITAGLFSILCGSLTGLIIFCFKFIAKKIEHYSKYLYELSKRSFLYIILVFIIIILLALIMYFVHKKIPETKGGGIPKSEGVLRGTLKFRSFLTLIGIFFGSMISYFAGVPVGLKDFLDSKTGWTNSHGGVEALIREDTMDSEFYWAERKEVNVPYHKILIAQKNMSLMLINI